MKSFARLWTFLSRQPHQRENIARLARLIGMVAAMVLLYSILFHVLMLREGRDPSWFTGVYWTLTVMTTLGFGDITFSTDLGRVFTVVVLLSGVVMLLIVLPFAFIRFLYAPWLEAQLRLRAPRAVPAGQRDHVVICRCDPVARALAARLSSAAVDHFVLEADPSVAARLHAEGIRVVVGDPESAETWAAVGVERASCVIANLSDSQNTNVVLTTRELADVTVIATVAADDSIDVLELAGAARALPLKRLLAERLAAWTVHEQDEMRIIGESGDVAVASVSVRHTGWTGRALADLSIPGLYVAGLWTHGRAQSTVEHPTASIASSLIVVGTRADLARWEASLERDPGRGPIVVIGGGRVGAAVLEVLRGHGGACVLVERSEEVAAKLRQAGAAARIVAGDAAERDVLTEAGIDHARSVIITTNDDSNNIYLTVYCRRLNPGLRIAARVTEHRNVEAVYRAGADFVVDEAGYGGGLLGSFVLRDMAGPADRPVDIELRRVAVPVRLLGSTFSTVARSRDALVVGYEEAGRFVPASEASTLLGKDGSLVLVVRPDRRAF